MGRNQFAITTTLVIVTMFVTAMAIANESSIHEMCSSKVSNYRAGFNERLSSIAITGTS